MPQEMNTSRDRQLTNRVRVVDPKIATVAGNIRRAKISHVVATRCESAGIIGVGVLSGRKKPSRVMVKGQGG